MKYDMLHIYYKIQHHDPRDQAEPLLCVFIAIPTAKTGNRKYMTKGLRKVIAKLLTQRVVLEVVSARRGDSSSQMAIRTKTNIKHAARMIISPFIINPILAQGSNKKETPFIRT
jgi:hypothetical protein